MEQPSNKSRHLLSRLPLVWKLYIGGGILLIIIGVLFFRWFLGTTNVSIKEEGKTVMSPTQVKSIEAIGEWEFLYISDEELVDTIRHGFFGVDELVRFYLKALPQGWVTMERDSMVCTLPSVKLLDENFIDETRTVSFYESGKWTAQDRSALYDRAYRAMRKRCLTKENLKRTEENARVQFLNLLRSMGYTNAIVKFEKEK